MRMRMRIRRHQLLRTTLPPSPPLPHSPRPCRSSSSCTQTSSPPPTYPPAQLPTCLPIYLPTYLPTHSLTYLPTHAPTYRPGYSTRLSFLRVNWLCVTLKSWPGPHGVEQAPGVSPGLFVDLYLLPGRPPHTTKPRSRSCTRAWPHRTGPVPWFGVLDNYQVGMALFIYNRISIFI
jgi:hypothetical protein